MVETATIKRGGMMSVDERIRYLMQAALRAEREGSERVARSLRRMAEEARPLDPTGSLPFQPCYGCSPE